MQFFQSNDASEDTKAKNPLFKLQKYNGSTCLETFLLQFKYLASYLRWKEDDKFYHMCASLEGRAGHILWELPEEGAKTADLERLLQARFGTRLQAESFKAKLRTRLQALYVDISRLTQLAHPGAGDSLANYVEVESFVNALNDRDLEYEIFKLKPTDLEEAVNHAVRLEALSNRTGGHTQGRSCTVFAASDDKPEKHSNADLLQRIAQLEKELKQAAKGSKNSSSKKTDSNGSSGHNSTGGTESASANGEGSRAGPDTHPCFTCKEYGHWHRDCPKRKSKCKEEANVQTLLSVSGNMSPTKIYVTAEVNGEPVRCLLDSGCERSVILADLAPNAKLTPLQYSLFAANRASLDVLGDTVLPFVTDGHNFEADMSVSNKVEDFLLGSEWLEKQGAQWDFAHGTVTLGDKCINVH